MPETPDASPEVNFDGDIGQLDSLAIHAFEIFSSLQRGGFTREEALTLVGHLVSSGFMEIQAYNKNYSGVELVSEEEDYLGLEDPDDEDFV